MYINENFLNLQENYLFSTIAKKVNEYKRNNPNKEIIKMGIGDVTRPLPSTIIESIKNATEEMGKSGTFKGYPEDRGYDFLINKIIEYDYKKKGVEIEFDEVFISDGAKSDCGNIVDIFGKGNTIGITNPVYPVYQDSNVIVGNKIIYIPLNKENNFIPEVPKERIDIIYLCFPNNPTGTVISKEELKKWVDYAKYNNSIIIYDSAYEAFITEENIPHSIYEIEGAKKVAIEIKSYSKTAGFTGLRCSYTIVPKEVIGYTKKGDKIELNKLWNRRQGTKFNGVSYIIQKAAETTYSKAGNKQIRENIDYYMNNAKNIYNGLEHLEYEVYGGKNAPYIWVKTPNNMSSWEFFDYLLNEKQIVGTPGGGFGTEGEGYFRFSAFCNKKSVEEFLKKIS